MAIQRKSASLARIQERPYSTLLNSTIELIKDPASLAVYVYLQTKAEGWIVRRTDVMNRFGFGKDKYAAIMKDLKDLGLVELRINRGEDGKVLDNTIVVHYEPISSSSVFTDTGENRMSDLPDIGENRHLEIDQVNTNESNNKNSGSVEPKKHKQEYCEQFEWIWQHKYERDGDNKKAAYKACLARIKSGSTWHELAEGMNRYKRYCQLTNTEPRYRKMLATFFGPDEHFKLAWTVSKVADHTKPSNFISAPVIEQPKQPVKVKTEDAEKIKKEFEKMKGLKL